MSRLFGKYIGTVKAQGLRWRSGAREKKAYPLRMNADVLDAIQRWADDELRSLNTQIEHVLREALRKSGRLRKIDTETDPPPPDPGARQW